MAITDKTRKLLWGRSGNRCAFCRIELVSEKDDNNVSLNLGEECHIISSKSKGPRHVSEFFDYDNYENLILLCRNHHKTIDEKVETYKIDTLKTIKKNHEDWVKKVLDSAKDKSKIPKSKIYPRIKTGKELLNIINSVHGSLMDNDELKNEQEVEIISSFFQNMKDWIDLFGMGAIEKAQEVKLGFDFNEDIKNIEALGFYLFGGIDKVRLFSGKNEDLGIFEKATLLALRQDNLAIINSDLVVTIKANETRVTF